MYEWSGYDTLRSNYLGDEGTHVAKCLWYLTKHPELSIPPTNRLEFLGGLYSKATLQLDLESYTKMPIRGVTSARVESIAAHPSEAAWLVVTLKNAKGQVTVVTQKKNAQQLKPGSIVPHATPGSNLGSRAIGIADKKGVQSHGLLVGNEELGLGAGNEVLTLEIPERLIKQYPDGIGVEMIELYRIPGTLPDTVAVLEQVTQWNREVSEVLKGLEGANLKLKKVWEDTRQWSIDEIKTEFGWLNCSFDHFFFESEYGETSKNLVREFQKKGVFVESDGAVGADLQSSGLGFCLLIKRDGTALYATRDLELAKKKFEQFHIDRSIYVVDAAQTLHFQQVFKCLELMGYEQVAKCFHCSYAQVVLPDGKMSSRKGNVILMSQLKQRLLSKIESDFLGKYRGEWPDAELDETARRIALGTMRYGMLNQDNQSMIVFDLEAWTARTGNTGPYMMYAYARTRSILRELGEKKWDWSSVDWSLLSHETEAEVLRHLNEYHSTVALAAERYSPHTLCAYVYELAKLFSRMYKQCSVVHAESVELQTARAGLVDATGRVIQHGLSLLGIETVERM
jgi:arginyl-tRNA synthetase